MDPDPIVVTAEAWLEAQPQAPRIVVYEHYFARGHSADVRLRVFNSEHHVHSVVLKLNSQFFFNFLDSADKAGDAPSTSKFNYEWVTKVDEDGADWSLVAAGPKAGDLNLPNYKGNTTNDMVAFSAFMSAIYGHRYTIGSLAEFLHLAKLGRYYQALPILASTIRNALHASRSLGVPAIWAQVDTLNVMRAAMDLRQEELFRDALVFAVGPWKSPQFRDWQDSDPELYRIANASHDKLRELVMGRQNAIMRYLTDERDELGRNELSSFIQVLRRAFDFSRDTRDLFECAPYFFRAILDAKFRSDRLKDLQSCLAGVMKNDLQLDYHESMVSGATYCADNFLLQTICSDEFEMPWDLQEEDW